MFGVGAAVIAPIYPIVAGAVGTGLPCPLRAITGVPCPGCGLTTAVISLARGDAVAAFVANPFVFGLLAITVIGLVALAARGVGLAAAPRAWPQPARNRCGQAMTVVACVSWLYQMHRVGFI